MSGRIRRTSKGSFKNTNKYFNKTKEMPQRFRDIMDRYGQEGVSALQAATPKDTGLTASKWYYEIKNWGIVFLNSNVVGNSSIAVLLQFGHATRGGSYVTGVDYINPALRPVFNKIANALRKEVMSL